MTRIYLDHNATTPIRPEVLESMLPYLREAFGNASSLHRFGQEAKKGIEEAREKVASLVSAEPMEIIFTSGGTEADNLAVKGIAYLNRERGRHIITSAVEHHAVLNACQFLEKEGFEVTYLPVDRQGMVDPEDVRKAVRKETTLVTIMHSNNEVGTLQPIEEIGRITGFFGIPFHSDAIQSVGKVPVNVRALGVDLLSLSAHKIYGPKGIGALVLRDGMRISPLLHGGHHEMNRRAGTENVAGIVGFGRAAELAGAGMEREGARVKSLRDYFWERLQERIGDIHLNGHPEMRLPNTLHASFDFIEGEPLLIGLDLEGIGVSGGSACTSGSLGTSHVLAAMGLSPSTPRGSLRFSLGSGTTKEEIDQTVKVLEKVVNRLRSMSPFWADRQVRS